MRSLIKAYLPYIKEYKREFVFAFFGMISFAIATAASAQLIKPVLDDIFVNKDEQMLKLIPFAIVAVFGMKGLGKFIQSYYTAYVGEDVVRRMRQRVVSHLMSLDMEFFNTHHSAELLSRVTNDINRIQRVVANIIPEFARDLLSIIALCAYVIYVSPKLSFYFLIIMPLAIYPLSRLAKRMRRYSRLSQESTADMTSRLDEIFSNIEVIKSNAKEEFEQQRFAKENDRLFFYNMKQVRTDALNSPVMEILGAVAIGLVIYVGGKEVIDSSMSVGSFFSFATALFMLYTPIKKISSLYNQSQDAVSANMRMQQLLQKEPKIEHGKKELTKSIQRVEFRSVGLEYADKRVLNGVSLVATKGQSIALVGDSGAGKSSLVNLLVKFYEPTFGDISIDEIDLKEITKESLYKKISYVTQRVYLFNDTIAANVAYGEEIDERRVEEALSKAHALEFVKRLENGIFTELTQRGANLSGGQRQRIALARALYKNPDILILDEATAALDNKSESIIQGVLEQIKDQMIIFVIAHRLSTVKSAEKILLFEDGEIVCEGTHEMLVQRCQKYRDLLQKN